jgi:dienelactone hydrolase
MPDNTIGGEATTETVRITGHQGDEIEAYLAYPPGPGPFAGVVVLHHMPGYDEATKQITEIFAANGYTAILPNLHWREALGASPDDAAAAVRAAGGVPDERLVGDVDGAARYLRSLGSANGKVGVIGYCSGGRQAFLAASRWTRRSTATAPSSLTRRQTACRSRWGRWSGWPAAFRARCWGCSAPRTPIRPRTRRPGSSRS